MRSKYVCPICLMEDTEYLALKSNKSSENILIKRIPTFIRTPEYQLSIKFVYTTIHKKCYEKFAAPLVKTGISLSNKVLNFGQKIILD